jgi:uncharacterized protein (DUF885 family)
MNEVIRRRRALLRPRASRLAGGAVAGLLVATGPATACQWCMSPGAGFHPAGFTAASVGWPDVDVRPDAADAEDPAMIARELFDDYDRWQMRESPAFALSEGDRSAIARLSDDSIAAQDRRARDRAAFRERLDAIDPATLSERDRVSLEIMRFSLDEADLAYVHREFLAPTDPLWGIHQTVANLAGGLPLQRAADFTAYVERVAALPAWIDDGVARMRQGIAEGRTPPRMIMEGIPAQIDPLLARGGLDSVRAPLARIPESVPAASRAALTERLETELLPAVRASLQRYRDFFADEYVPACRDSIAATDAPDGAAWYAGRLRTMTTTDLTAQQIHDIGLREVARIRSEMMAVIERTDWFNADPARGSLSDDERFDAFVEFLRTDPRFYHDTPRALLAGYRDICKRIDALLPAQFGPATLPRLPYGVGEIPPAIAPRQTTAYYQPGSPASGVAGMFMANTYRLDQRPIYEMIPLSLHEAVPGHHLQIALAQELTDVPRFRRVTWVTAYGEGWALYTERLGIEMGLYEDPYDDFGRLLFEMWRACRLVVDPGMHALGWSRERAVEFMLANTALAEVNIRAEVDRYIAWPGQATAYKIGELRIRELRQLAERRLGPAFDPREFHAVVLAEGGVTLPILERRVRAWLDRRPGDVAYD